MEQEQGEVKDRQAERHTYVTTEHITGIGGDVTSQAEVTDLCHPAVSQQNVSSCKVPVDALQTQRQQ